MRNRIAQRRSRILRNNSTDAERFLWQRLRGRQIGGYRFRRQVPIGSYIADFVSIDANIHINHDEPFRAAAECGHLKLVKYLVYLGSDVRARGDYAIYWAVFNGHLDIVKYLVKKGADVSSKNNIAVRIAALHGHLEIVQYLVENGADIHVSNEYALLMASESGHLDVVQYLASLCTDIRNINDAIYWASAKGHLHIVKYLVSLGGDVHGSGNPLQWPLANGHFEMVKYLAEQGVSTETVDGKCLEYLKFCDKMKAKAQKKIYFWWIPICYDMSHPSGCGKRMAKHSLEAYNKIINNQ